MQKIRVFLVDDHTVVRQGLRRILESDEEIEIVGEAGDGRTAIDLVQKIEGIYRVFLSRKALHGDVLLKISSLVTFLLLPYIPHTFSEPTGRDDFLLGVELHGFASLNVKIAVE